MHQVIERTLLQSRSFRSKLTTRVSNRRFLLTEGGGKKKRSHHTAATTRSVSFNSKVTECYTLPLEEYSDNEYFASWYSDEEYEVVMRKCLKIIKKIDLGEIHIGKTIHLGKTVSRKYCVRGLEGMTPAAPDERMLVRTEAYIAVLEEQLRQRRSGYCDPDAIAQRYRFAAAKSCQEKATQVGQRDAKSVERQ